MMDKRGNRRFCRRPDEFARPLKPELRGRVGVPPGTPVAEPTGSVSRLATVLLLTLASLTFQPADADACSCARPGPPCDAVFRADAVFLGRVLSIEPINPQEPGLGSRNVELLVEEAYRGTDGIVMSVVTGPGDGGGGCGYPFKVGETYVVYANRANGVLTTSSCSRTRPLAEAAEDLKYARSLAAIPPDVATRIAGKVLLIDPMRPATSPPAIVPRVTVTAINDEVRLSTFTNSAGEYVLRGLAFGKYEVRAEPPEGYEPASTMVNAFDPRGCGTTDLWIRYDGRVSGRVVDRSGVAVSGIPLDLVPATDVDAIGGGVRRVSAWTAADGTFEMRLVPPGEYLLGFSSIRTHDRKLTYPRAFYPGVVAAADATPVVVSIGHHPNLEPFVMPESIRLVMVNGVVVDADGRPVNAAAVVLRDNTEGPNMIGPRFVTGPDGRFTFSVPAQRYDVHVTRSVAISPDKRETHTAIMPFTASAATPPITVVVKPPPGDR
jgi:hypothetical protein